MASIASRVRAAVCALLFPFFAAAASTDFRVFLDADHDAATGCTIAGMAGVDHVFTTHLITTDTRGAVTRTYAQACVSSSGLGPEVEIDAAGWPAGFSPSTGLLLVETRFPAAVIGGSIPSAMRIGVQAVSGAATHTAIAGPDGQPVTFPSPATLRRRSADSPGSDRAISLDGAGEDWQGLAPAFDGLAEAGTPALRMTKVFAYAGRSSDAWLWFRFDATLADVTPLATDDRYTRPAGAGISVAAPGVLANDRDPNGLPLTVAPASAAAHGQVTLHPDGSFTYTPDDPSSSVTDTFEYRSSNGMRDSSAAQVRIHVAASTNIAPVAAADTFTASEDTTLDVPVPGVLANDTDANGDEITAALLTAPANGTVTLNPDGGFTYAPRTGYFGTDTFTYTVSDGSLTDTASVTITVTRVNAAPMAEGQSVVATEDTPLAIVLTGSDADGDVLTYATSAPAHGTLTGTAPNVTYTPDPNFSGTDSFTFTASDGTATSNTAKVTIAIDAVNDAPVARRGSATTNEDVSVAIVLTATDVEGETLTYSASTPAHGTLTGTAPNVVYTPAADFSGTDSFTFTASDGIATSNAGTVTITVDAVNDAPTATPQSVEALEDTPLPIVLTGSDVENDALTFTVTAMPAHGALTGVAPNLSYTPDADFNGADSFTFRVDDSGASSSEVTVSIAVAPVNDAPVAVAMSVGTAEDTPLPIALAAIDADGDAITWTIVTAPANGLLSGIAPDIIYTPEADYHGTDSFVVRAGDGAASSEDVTVTIGVTAVNDLPVAGAQSVAATEDVPVAITLTGSDVDGDALTWQITASPCCGVLSGVAPDLVYTPNRDFAGSDALTFVVSDGQGFSTPASIDIAVAPVDDPASADDQSVTTEEDTPLAITLTGGDADGPVVFAAGSPAHGTLTGSAPGLTYTPDADFHGSDSFTFTVTNTAPVSGTVTIDVKPVNDAPVASDGSSVTSEDTASATVLMAADTDGDTLTWRIVDAPAHGSLNGTAPNLTYTPAGDYEGPDSFTFLANDGTVDSNLGTFTLQVTGVNDAPAITSSSSFTTAENIPSATFAIGAADPDAGDSVSFAISGGADAARFAIDADGTLRFVSAPDFEAHADADANDVYEVEVRVDDAAGASDVQLVSVAVTDAPDAPRFTSVAVAAAVEDSPYAYAVATADQDAGTTLTITATTLPSWLTLTDHGDGTATLAGTPLGTHTGTQSVVLVVSDGVDSATQSFGIIVSAVNDAPVIIGGDLTVKENSYNRTTVATFNAVDEDGDAVTWAITGGDGAGVFAIDPTTGRITVADRSRLDYETVTGYSLTVTATDDASVPASTSMTVTVIVEDVNEAPVVGQGFLLVPENSSAGRVVGAVTYSDDDRSQSHTFSIVSGNELGAFSIDAAGNIVVAPGAVLDFESRTGPFTLYIAVTDDGTPPMTGTMYTEIYVTNVNEPPVFTTTALSVAENTTTTRVLAADPERSPVVYAITGGPDAALFSIESTFGGLTFNSAPDFEAPADSDGDNVYVLEVTITSGFDSTTGTITVTVTDVDEAPVFVSPASVTASENSVVATTVTAADPEAASVTYAIVGGTDAALFSIDPSTGALSFVIAPDYERPGDDDGDNVYLVDLSATAGPTVVQSFAVTLTDVNEAPILAVTGAVTHTEGGGPVDVLTGATISDVDDTNIESATITITTNLRNGADSLSFTNTASITGVYDSSIGELKLTGTATLAEYEAALRSIRFDNTADYQPVSTRGITWTVRDGDLDSAPQTTVVNMAGVNQAPDARALTSSTSTPEDTPKIWPYADIWFYDTELEGSWPYRDARLTITATRGTVTLGSTTGLDFTFAGAMGDGVDDAQMVFQGSIIDLRIAVAGLAFTPEADYNGPASIAITIDDLGVDPGPALQDTVTIDITVTPVNDAPLLVVSGAATYQEKGAPVALASSVALSDPDDTMIDSATIFISNNFAYEDYLSFSNTAAISGLYDTLTGELQLSGSAPLADYLAALQSLQFSSSSGAASTAQRTITWSVFDGTDWSVPTDSTVDVTVRNNGPIIFAPSGLTTAEDAPLSITTLSVVDWDSGSDDVEVTLTVTHGVVDLDPSATGGLSSLTGDGSASIVAVGPVAQISDALEGMVFTPELNYSGIATVAVGADDRGHNPGPALVDAKSIDIAVSEVNDPPVAAGDTVASGAEDAGPWVIALAPLLSNDRRGPADENGQTLSITAVGSAVGGTVSISGTDAVFTPDPEFNGAASFEYTLEDDGTTAGAPAPATAIVPGSVGFVVAEVNDAPAGADDYPPDAVAEDSGPHTFTSAALLANDSRGPANESGQTLTIVGVDNVVGGSASVVSGDVVFDPAPDYAGTGSFRYTFSDDGTTNGASDPLTSTATATFTISPVPDAPQVNVAPTSEGTSTAVSFAVNAVDLSDVTHIRVDSVTGGTLINSLGSHIPPGTLVPVALAGSMRYFPSSHRNTLEDGAAWFSIEASAYDAGRGLAGSSTVVFVHVSEVNDAPWANPDSPAVTPEANGIIRIPIATLLANDSKGWNEFRQTLEMISVTPGAVGTVGISGSDVVFKPPIDFYGPMNFTYVIRDNGTTNGVPDPREATGTVTVNVP